MTTILITICLTLLGAGLVVLLVWLGLASGRSNRFIKVYNRNHEEEVRLIDEKENSLWTAIDEKEKEVYKTIENNVSELHKKIDDGITERLIDDNFVKFFSNLFC